MEAAVPFVILGALLFVPYAVYKSGLWDFIKGGKKSIQAEIDEDKNS